MCQQQYRGKALLRSVATVVSQTRLNIIFIGALPILVFSKVCLRMTRSLDPMTDEVKGEKIIIGAVYS
jgi:hypothetical protein